MLIITDDAAMARALASPLDQALKRLLVLRREQLLTDTSGEYELGDLVHFVVVEFGDDADTIEAAVGFPLFTEPSFEWVTEADGWFEAVTILSDDGFGIALCVSGQEGIDPEILTALRSHAACTTSAEKPPSEAAS